MQPLNSGLISALGELQDISSILGNLYREKAYRAAIAGIKKLDFEITAENVGELSRRKVSGVGAAILAKIREYVASGSIAELLKLRESPAVRARREFDGLLGVGPVTAGRWFEQGVDSIAKLRRAVGSGDIKLTHMQKLGLLYYTDLNTRIPRDEVTKLSFIMKSLLLAIDPSIIFEVSGSYRREKPDSGDIDILVSNKKHFDKDLLTTFVSLVSEDPNFVDTVVAGGERATILYRSPFSRKVRQIDILNVAYGSYFAALNYFTGGFIHNAWLRGVAKKQGYRLNQAGLFKVVGGVKDGKKSTMPREQIIPLHSENELYKILGVDYIPPVRRL